MRATVWTDPALAKHAGRFVWLSINAEEAKNAEFLASNKILGFPTFLVIDPATEKVAKQWLGGLTVRQAEGLLDDGERAVGMAAGAADADPLTRGDRLAAEGKWAEAVAPYTEALAAAPPAGAERAKVVEALVGAASLAGDSESCATIAAAEAPGLERDSRFLNVVVNGLGCAVDAPDDAPWKAQATATILPLVDEATKVESALADDRSSAYGMLVGYRKETGDAAGAKELAGQWLAFLESAAASATDVEARAAFDSHRVSAALELGTPERVIPAIEQSERDLPDDYNPPARLAILYRAAGRLEDALAASDRALERAYGPRKLRIYLNRADILDDMGRGDDAKRTLEEALAHAGTLPEAQRPKSLVAHIESRLGSNG